MPARASTFVIQPSTLHCRLAAGDAQPSKFFCRFLWQPKDRGPGSDDIDTMDDMDSMKDSARRWFDRRAGSYESGVTSRWRDPVQRASLEALDLTADDRLLDVGCGTGAASRGAAAAATSVVGSICRPR
jgi:hypothetical protein